MTCYTQSQGLRARSRIVPKKTRVLLAHGRMDAGQPKATDAVYSKALISEVSFSSKILWFINLFLSQNAIDIKIFSRNFRLNFNLERKLIHFFQKNIFIDMRFLT